MRDRAGEEVLAWYDNEEDVIYVWSGLEGGVFKRVLMHEVAHVILRVSGLSNILEDKMEEAVCDAFEGMADLIQDRKFVEFMNE